jgi:hypothetical protein
MAKMYRIKSTAKESNLHAFTGSASS